MSTIDSTAPKIVDPKSTSSNPTTSASMQVPDASGRFGDFGGRYVP